MTNDNVTRYVRFNHDGQTSYGLLEGDEVRELEGSIFEDARPTGRTHALGDVTLDIPLDPARVQKVIGVSFNYNLPGLPRDIPHPRWFAKLPSALNRHEGAIELPPYAENMNFEGELVAIIGRKARHVSIEDAPGYVFGVTIGNDVSENTWFYERQGEFEPSRLVSKSNDTWACLYTTVVCGLDYSDLGIEVILNGETVAKGRTRDMTHSVASLVSYLSQFATLLPGDIIYTGTVAPPVLPGARHAMRDGDVIEVTIEQIGTLLNRVVAAGEHGDYRPIRKG